MKSFTWRILLCLIPVALAGYVVGRAYYLYQRGQSTFKLGVELAGGTRLVYEVDPAKAPPDFKLDELAERLKRRLDPADLYSISVRSMPPNGVEIILPLGGAGAGRQALTAEEIERRKELIARAGSLRFTILANPVDDREVIEAARRLFGTNATPEFKARLDAARMDGQIPPAPTQVSADGEGFMTPKGRFTYSWIELGRKMRHQYGLDNAVEKEGGRDRTNWMQMAEARKTNDIRDLGGMVLFSREVPSERDALLPKQDQGRRYEYFVLARNPETPDHEVTGASLSRATAGSGNKGGLAVHFVLNTEGGNRFWDLTSANKPDSGGFKRQLAIVLDEMIESAPTIDSPIRTEGQISGSFTKQEVDQLVNVLRAGALPATLKPTPAAQENIEATLGQETIVAGTWAIVVAFLAVLGFMMLYYRFAGLVASIALLANLLLTVAVMLLVNATFTLPGLAGLVLMLGMAVDANVLIYERFREERERGASITLALRNAYDRSFATIIDTHLSSIFTAIVLYVVGNAQLKGFGISLTLGLIISLFTSLYMTRLIFDFWVAQGWLTRMSMFEGLSGWIHRNYIDFMKIRRLMFTATVILTILGGALFLIRGQSGLNIDFTGGTVYRGELTTPVTQTELTRALGAEAQAARLVIPEGGVTEVPGSEGYSFLIRYQGDEPRRVDLANPDTVENVRQRASRLGDFSAEILPPGALQSGQFSAQTSERARELVEVAINRLIESPDQDKVRLKKKQLGFENIRIDATTGKQQVDLKFTEAGNAKKVPAFASEIQVRRFLERELRQAPRALAAQARLLGVRGDTEAKEENGERYSTITVSLNPVDVKELTTVLERLQREFSDRPQPIQVASYGGQLVEEMKSKALYAIVASWGAILLYLWFRFGSWTFGAAAVLCLIHDLFFTLGIIALCHFVHDTFLGRILMLQDFKIDLPTVAALLTLVGYSVNDTIVVFDRIREVRGKNPELSFKMINDSVNQTLTRTLLASLTTWLVVIVLYIFGGEGVHLFAFVMVVGVFVGTYSSIYIASPLLIIFGEGVGRSVTKQTAEAAR